MIHALFPTAVYSDQNKDLLPNANKLFNLAKDDFYQTNNGVRTTLKEYCPGKAVTPFDPLKLVEIIRKNNTEANLKLVETTPLKMYFRNSVEKYLNDTGYDKYQVEITNIWMNEMESGGAHTPHTHYGYHFSGTYYVDLPQGSDKVIFHSLQEEVCRPSLNHINSYNEYNSLQWAMNVFPGTIVVFPANLKHSVPVMKYEGTRRCVAFDAVCHPIYKEAKDV